MLSNADALNMDWIAITIRLRNRVTAAQQMPGVCSLFAATLDVELATLHETFRTIVEACEDAEAR